MDSRGLATAEGTAADEEKQRVLNAKQERLLELIKKKKECDKRAQEIVLKLIEQNVTERFLLDNAFHLNPSHFEDVIEERKLSGICGWVLCDLSMEAAAAESSSSSGTSKKKGVIPKYSIRGNKVLDVRQRRNFCSAKCYARAYHFKKQLLTSPLYLRDQDVLELQVSFEILEDDSELHGIAVNLTGIKLDDDEIKTKRSNPDGDESSTTSDEEDYH